jgi:FixJ family two-component response regulator
MAISYLCMSVGSAGLRTSSGTAVDSDRCCCHGLDPLPNAPVISIVDDDEGIRLALNSLMRSLGYAARTFPSAEDFLQSGEVARTSCLICDIQMPNMSGLELQAHLTAQGHRIPIIFITAFPNDGVTATAMRAGALRLLIKPFDQTALVEGVTAALSGVHGNPGG